MWRRYRVERKEGVYWLRDRVARLSTTKMRRLGGDEGASCGRGMGYKIIGPRQPPCSLALAGPSPTTRLQLFTLCFSARVICHRRRRPDDRDYAALLPTCLTVEQLGQGDGILASGRDWGISGGLRQTLPPFWPDTCPIGSGHHDLGRFTRPRWACVGCKSLS